MTPNTNHTIASSLQISRQPSHHALGQFHEPVTIVSQSFHLALLSIEGNNCQGMQLNRGTDGETAATARGMRNRMHVMEQRFVVPSRACVAKDGARTAISSCHWGTRAAPWSFHAKPNRPFRMLWRLWGKPEQQFRKLSQHRSEPEQRFRSF